MIKNKDWLTVLLAFSLTGCTVTGGHKDDPLEGVNRGIYGFNRFVDRGVIKPTAKGYEKILPSVARKGINNFFYNIETIPTIGNDILQFNFKMALNDSARLVVNSTVGILGFIDVASNFGLERHRLDFGQTLGKWGYKNSTYLVLPFIGPSTFRDTLGLAGNWYMSPWPHIKKDSVRYGLKTVELIDLRANLLTADKVLETATDDEYEFVRNAYLDRRDNFIKSGQDKDNIKKGSKGSDSNDPFEQVEVVN